MSATDVPTPPTIDTGPRVEISLATPMLVDRYLPRFDTTIHTHQVIDAEQARTWQALTELDLLDVRSPLTDAAMFARGLPDRIAALLGRETDASPPPEALTLTGEFSMDGWMGLGQDPGTEIAFGAIGRFWQPQIEWYDVSDMTSADFAAFSEEGWGKIVASFSLRPYGEHRTLVSYEARTATADPASARRFATYWTLVRPFVSHIMAATLTTLRRHAEAAPGAA